MNGLDLTKLTDKELAELRKALIEESSQRGVKVKSNARIYGQLIELGLEGQLKREGLNNNQFDASHIVASVEKAIQRTCDIALGNYAIQPSNRSSYKKNQMTLKCNGSSLYDECYKDYMEMAQEIVDIFKKYYEKSKKYRAENIKKSSQETESEN